MPTLQWKLCPFNELSLHQLYELLKLRQEVFIVEQNCPYLDTDGKDQLSHHLMGYDPTNRMVAYARLLPQGVSYEEASIGRIITATSERSKGYGVELMRVSIRRLEELYNTTAIRISAQCYLEKFYRYFGFQPVGESYLEDDIPHIEMLRE